MKLLDHLNKLDVYTKIIEAGAIKSACQSCFLSQPQLSKILKQLEETLEKELVIRTPQGITPTPAGHKLYHYAKKLIQSASEAEYDIKAPEAELKGNIRLGTYDSIAAYCFPPFIQYFKNSAPGLKLHLTTARSSEVFSLLKKQSIDMAVIVDPPSSIGIQVERVYQDSFALFEQPSINPIHQKTIIFLRSTQAVLKSNIGAQFGQYSLTQCDNLETVKTLTEKGLGIGVLPRRVAREGILANKLRPHFPRKFPAKGFASHAICLCHKQALRNKKVIYVVNELKRFLKDWSQN